MSSTDQQPASETGSENPQYERERLRRALDGRTRCERDGLTYRGYRFERPEWLLQAGASNVFRVYNPDGSHVENISPCRFAGPSAALEYIDALIDEDPDDMREWLSTPVGRLSWDDETVRA